MIVLRDRNYISSIRSGMRSEKRRFLSARKNWKAKRNKKKQNRAKMTTNQNLTKAVSRKLKYYMEVKRLEDGFDLSVNNNNRNGNDGTKKSGKMLTNRKEPSVVRGTPTNVEKEEEVSRVDDECGSRYATSSRDRVNETLTRRHRPATRRRRSHTTRRHKRLTDPSFPFPRFDES